MEENAMMMILYSGNANQRAFAALRKIRNRDFDDARTLIKEAKEESLKAHEIQTSLLTKIASGEQLDLDVLTVHAQDHLMNSVLAIDMIEEMIEVFASYAQ